MRLSYEQMVSITQGTVRTELSDGYMQFYRFSREQEEIYLQVSPQNYYCKTFATAGVRFSFFTDAAFVVLKYRMRKASSRCHGWFDVYENGVLIDHFGGAIAESFAGEREILLSPWEKHIEIYFPWSAAAEIAMLELSNGASLRPATRKRQLLSFGDSITQGYDAQYPSLSYHSRLCRVLRAEGINKGIGGEKFFPELLSSREDISPDIITVAYGTNDWSKRDRRNFEENCYRFMSILTQQYPDIPIFAITPLWRADWNKQTPFGAPLWEAVKLLEKIYAGFATVTVISGRSLVPHLPEFYADGYLHPNDLGFADYGANVGTKISGFLR